MAKTDRAAITQWRKRRERLGFVRVEVQVLKEDAPLLRGIASALGDPARGADTRALLRERIGVKRAGGLKALLAAAPLDGVEIDRPRDTGREAPL